MSAIPPIEPTRPSHASRKVRRRSPEDESEERPAGAFDQSGAEREDSADDDGLPHVDIRV
jgi:hypothetical protein